LEPNKPQGFYQNFLPGGKPFQNFGLGKPWGKAIFTRSETQFFGEALGLQGFNLWELPDFFTPTRKNFCGKLALMRLWGAFGVLSPPQKTCGVLGDIFPRIYSPFGPRFPRHFGVPFFNRFFRGFKCGVLAPFLHTKWGFSPTQFWVPPMLAFLGSYGCAICPTKCVLRGEKKGLLDFR